MRTTIRVFTFKAGLLARVAHDLQLTPERFAFTLHAQHLEGYCDAGSLCIDGAVTPHGLDRETPNAGDKRQILQTVREEILLSDRYPRIELKADLRALAPNRVQLTGTLQLRGTSQPIEGECSVRAEHPGVARAVFELLPSRFGIAPYKALAGAIRLQDRVRVEVELELGDATLQSFLERGEPLQLSAATS
jgi:hypothetical protein